MVFKHAKLALLTGFVMMADAKMKGKKWGFRKDADPTDDFVDDDEDDFMADSFDAQKDSKFPDIDMLDSKLAKQLRKKGKKNKGGKGSERDFAKGVLETIAETVNNGEENQMVPLDALFEIFDRIVGEDYDPEGNRAFERGYRFADRQLYDEPGCRAECIDAPFAEECQSCCISYEHQIDWNCDSTDEANPPAKCCTEWTEDCFTTDSDKNNNHACKDCGGYGRGYGGYGRWGRRLSTDDVTESSQPDFPGYGRRRSYGYSRGYGGYSRGYGGYGRRYGRRRSSQGYGRGRRRAGQGYGRGR